MISIALKAEVMRGALNARHCGTRGIAERPKISIDFYNGVCYSVKKIAKGGDVRHNANYKSRLPKRQAYLSWVGEKAAEVEYNGDIETAQNECVQDATLSGASACVLIYALLAG